MTLVIREIVEMVLEAMVLEAMAQVMAQTTVQTTTVLIVQYGNCLIQILLIPRSQETVAHFT